MSNPIPSLLALTSIADGSAQQASPIRNNYSAIQSAVNELIAALSGGASGQMLEAADASDVQYAYPPGHEYARNAFAADVPVTATTAATANTVVTGTAVVYDGTPILVEFFAPYGINVPGSLLNIELYDGATPVATMCAMGAAAAIDTPLNGKVPITPTAGSHTYSARAWTGSAGTATVKAGAGSGAGVLVNGWIRVTKI